ncbi:MAG TPA: ribonuclease G [Gammaproteobacteria bacterium]|nr:ribonuclease G [Gammaproteobacteria bacterium]
MTEEILINVTPQETRVALVENGALQEVFIERAQRRGWVGNLYLGRVSRVLPGMGAAFIDVGLARTAFLHISDITGNDADDGGEEVTIEQILKEGQSLLVQVIKDPIGSKGARLTTQISIPSRYLVFMPNYHAIGISQRIGSEEERNRLREILQRRELALRTAAGGSLSASADNSNCGGYIARTAAEGVGEDKLIKDGEFLQRLWCSIQQRIEQSEAPTVIYEDLPLMLRVLRDLAGLQIRTLCIDSRENFARLVEFAQQFVPDLVPRIEHYPGERPIFEFYSIEEEIQKALDRKVELKSGGHLIIDQTEAMTTIDVNTGAFVGHRNLEETIFKTNLEASHAIARQLRLRNLGGIIIVDFIDMKDSDHQRQVLRALERSLERDHAKITVSEVTSLGLVQITRKRTRESLEHVLCEACPTCHGRGSIKTVETVCYEIFREVMREARQFDASQLLVVAARNVVDRLLDEESASVAELEAFIKRPIRFQAEPLYNPEQFDVVLL